MTGQSNEWIDSLEASVRVRTALINAGVRSVEDVRRLGPMHFRRGGNFGERSARELDRIVGHWEGMSVIDIVDEVLRPLLGSDAATSTAVTIFHRLRKAGLLVDERNAG